MRRRELKDIEGLLDEIAGDNDRAAIIVGAAFVDHLLESFVDRALPKLSKEDRDRIFTDGGLLGTFSAKILWAYTTGLIGPMTRHSLDMIRRIRNETAHSPNRVSFKSASIKGLALAIEFSKPDVRPKDPRARYVGVVNLLSLALMESILKSEDYPELVGRLLE